MICRKLFKDGPTSTYTAFCFSCGDKSSVQSFQLYVLKFCRFQRASSKVSSLFIYEVVSSSTEWVLGRFSDFHSIKHSQPRECGLWFGMLLPRLNIKIGLISATRVRMHRVTLVRPSSAGRLGVKSNHYYLDVKYAPREYKYIYLHIN